ncbi:MAG: hypothetical protein FWD82_10060 [Defluviitaleaceae bacterium]|nr:hypothetical protein [Defluviitaleaceae bacterium]
MKLEHEERIIAMTKLAAKDKKFAFKDGKTSDYFKHDFVYKRNFRSRFLAGIGAIILLVFFYVHRAFVREENLMLIDFQTEAIRASIFVLAIFVLYTIIGSLKANKEYAESQKRLKTEANLIKYIEFLEEKEAELNSYGTNTYTKGNDNH